MDSKITDLYFRRVLNESHDETDMSNPEERKELTIGKKILEIIKTCETTDASYAQTLRDIKAQAQMLVDMHTKS
jgi:hypothetical protein